MTGAFAREGAEMGMESVLPEWYDHDDDTLGLIVKTGTIALDANVMLDLYRVGREQRDEILTVLRTNRERLFVPYQAAYEFQKNRLLVAGDAVSAYESLRDSLNLTFNDKLLGQIRDPAVQNEIRELVDTAIETTQSKLDELRDQHTIPFDEVATNDPIRRELDELLKDSGQLGKPPSTEELKASEEQYKQRVANHTPPGYLDAEKKKGASGDYLIWVELLGHAKAVGRPVLFITNDRKGDWYRATVRDTAGGPRAELVAEMRSVASEHSYHQVPLERFLELAVEHLNASVDEATIEAVERISRRAAIVPDAAYSNNLISSIGPNVLDNYPGFSPDLMAASTRFLDPMKFGGYDFSAQAAESFKAAMPKYNYTVPAAEIFARAGQGQLDSFRKIAESAAMRPDYGAFTTSSRAAEAMRRAASVQPVDAEPPPPSQKQPAKKPATKNAASKKLAKKKPIKMKPPAETPDQT